ncbi:carboxypeptidase-like regulatory domain-containing protein [Winogradskyella tangerina]|uniref:carboxypeptidase-like regulatory domain-containing protein n=1 Tax=Winogradskyella tangerina TaxID=2023240 RepID=UPI000DBE206F|nr:carboxypeptidase-like regulatory domain-containing protein [Winogradskyella tangerina]
MRIFRSLFCITCFLVFSGVFAQVQYKIEIRDVSTEEPVSFATIRFDGSNRGLIADYNGQFRLPFITAEDISFLVITSIGYQELKVEINSLLKNELNILRMQSQTEALDAVILNSKKPRVFLNEVKKNKKLLASDIVRKAVYAIPVNLDDKPHSYIGYYRDYQIIDELYFNLNEGILEQYDGGIYSNKVQDSVNQSVFYSFKTNRNFNVDEYYTKAYNEVTKYIQNADILPYGGNELTLLNVHDAIRNYDISSFSFVYKITRDFLFNHEFVKGDVRFIDDEPVINIIIESKKGKVSYAHTAYGVISISLEDFSIHNFSYTVYDFNKLNPLFNIETEYRRQDGAMYLNYITFNNRFVITDGKIFQESNVIYNREQNRFYVNFDTDLDVKTVQRRDFKIRYNDKRIFIQKLEILNPQRISLQVADFDDSLKELTFEEMDGFTFNIRNISDINGRVIYEPQKKLGYQFREFFVQEVIPRKIQDESLKVIPKNSGLMSAPINENTEMDVYIINSPLMQRRMKKDKN